MKILLTIGAVAALALSFIVAVPEAEAGPTGVQIVQQIGAVFEIALENHNLTQPNPTSSPEQILGNSAAPYLNSLMTPGQSNAVYTAYATKYYNAGNGVHPSEPNYVWAEAGTDFGSHTDNDPTSGNGNIFSAPHLTGQLNAAGIAWKNYQEDVQLSSKPTVSASGTSSTVINPYYHTGQWGYAAKHNPMAFFTDTPAQNVYALTNLATDLANNSVGRYNWITPNLYNDQHSALNGSFTYHGTAYTGDQAAVAQGDNFLSIIVPQIMASKAFQNNGVIIIRMDETEGGDTTSYTLPEIVISPLAKGNAYASSVVMSHSSDLKTMEEMLGLSFLSNAIPSGETAATGGYNSVATVNDLSDFFQAVPVLGVQQPAGTPLGNGFSVVSFGNVYPGVSVTNSFVLTNSGIGTLVVSNIAVTGATADDFAVGGITLPLTIASNGAVTFAVSFSPGAGGARNATLQITGNDNTHNPFTVGLAGGGLTNSMPLLSSDVTLDAAGFHLTFTAPVGQHYRVLSSTDLTWPLEYWNVVTSGIITTNPAGFVDSTAGTNAEQFFRIVSP